jgi:integrase
MRRGSRHRGADGGNDLRTNGDHGQALETLRTYGEHLYDWFDALEQSGIEWHDVDERVIAAYRNRMLENPSAHTGQPYARATINARVSTVCRFYGWAFVRGLIDQCPFRLTEKMTLMLDSAYRPGLQRHYVNDLIVSRPEKLPRPLRADELARLFAHLRPTARLAAQWALGAGLRRKELCALDVSQIPDSWPLDLGTDPLVGVSLHIAKGDRPRTCLSTTSAARSHPLVCRRGPCPHRPPRVKIE